MFRTKKKKIAAHLAQQKNTLSAFDELLGDYLSGAMKGRLGNLEISKIDLHIDWLPEYRCINIQGKFRDYFLDFQVEPDAFEAAYDRDEPEDPVEYPLGSAEQFYESVGKIIEKLRK